MYNLLKSMFQANPPAKKVQYSDNNADSMAPDKRAFYERIARHHAIVEAEKQPLYRR